MSEIIPADVQMYILDIFLSNCTLDKICEYWDTYPDPNVLLMIQELRLVNSRWCKKITYWFMCTILTKSHAQFFKRYVPYYDWAEGEVRSAKVLATEYYKRILDISLGYTVDVSVRNIKFRIRPTGSNFFSIRQLTDSDMLHIKTKVNFKETVAICSKCMGKQSNFGNSLRLNVCNNQHWPDSITNQFVIVIAEMMAAPSNRCMIIHRYDSSVMKFRFLD